MVLDLVFTKDPEDTSSLLEVNQKRLHFLVNIFMFGNSLMEIQDDSGQLRHHWWIREALYIRQLDELYYWTCAPIDMTKLDVSDHIRLSTSYSSPFVSADLIYSCLSFFFLLSACLTLSNVFCTVGQSENYWRPNDGLRWLPQLSI